MMMYSAAIAGMIPTLVVGTAKGIPLAVLITVVILAGERVR